MAKYSNTLEFKLKSTMDNSGFTKLKSELVAVQNLLKQTELNFVADQNTMLNQTLTNVNKIQLALTSAFDVKSGILNIQKLNAKLDEAGVDINKVASSLAYAGSTGQTAFNSLVATLGKFDVSLKTTSTMVDKFVNTLGNTARWGVTASIFETLSNKIRSAVEYVEELDTSLNDIMIVSDYNTEQMRQFSLYANKAAQALGQTTTAYTNASLIFAQQGYSLEDSNKLAELTLKVANTTGQTTSEVSEQITSWVNGYNLSLSELESTLDKVTKVAAVGASDTEELMTAASKVASAASTLGVSTDQLLAQMSTIISVTREAPGYDSGSPLAMAA